jgi:hypothetical protein
MPIASPSAIVPHRWNWSIENRTLCRRVRRSKHMIRQPQPAWSFDLETYQALRSRFERVRVSDTESGLDYEVDADLFDRAAARTDRGFGVQMMLTLPHWRVSRREGSQMPLFAEVAM